MDTERRRTAEPAFLAIASALSPAVAADWPQDGADAGRSSRTADPGPAWSDVALLALLPSASTPTSPILVLGDHALVLSRADNRDRIYRVALGDGGVETFAESAPRSTGNRSGARHAERTSGAGASEEPPRFTGATAIASDGRAVFVAHEQGLLALRTSDAGPEWNVRLGGSRCAPPAVGADVVVVACRSPVAWEVPLDSTVVVAIDASDGSARWSWSSDRPTGSVNPGIPGGIVLPPRAASSDPLGVSIVGDRTMLVTREAIAMPSGWWGVPDAGTVSYAVTALDRSGRALWTKSSAQRLHADGTPLGPVATASTHAVAFGDLALVVLDRELFALNATNGYVRWRALIADPEPLPVAAGNGIAATADAVFVTSASTLYRISADGEERWRHDLPDGESWTAAAPVIAGDQVLATSLVDHAHGTSVRLRAVVAETGETAWTVESPEHWGRGRAPEPPVRLAAAGAALAVLERGTVTVYGTTAGSPTAVARPSTTTPLAREVVRVDLSGSGPGARGPATSYRADWGDGASTGWVAQPFLDHAYVDVADREARFHVRNAEGQSASTTLVFRVQVPEVVRPMSAAEALAAFAPWITLAAAGAIAGGGAAAVAVWRRR